MRALPFFATLAALGTTTLLAAGQPSDSGDDRRPRRSPPPIAIEACEGKNAGDACSFETPHGHTIEGECAQIGETIACKPDRPPPRSRRGRGDGSERPSEDDQ
jgi:hypothetical protein